MRRRTLMRGLGAAAALGAGGLAGCDRGGPGKPPLPSASWVGARHERGHRLREAAGLAAGPWPGAPRRTRVLVVGAGIAGLAAARAFARRGIDDVQVLELEDSGGGNARGHRLGGQRCPLGAHYLPLPPPEAHEVAEWLHEIGLLREEAGRTVADERHLCHSPQERLFYEGTWIEGLLPPAPPQSQRLAQYRLFGARVAAAQAGPAAGRGRRFALPAHRSSADGELTALGHETFAAWLARERLDDPALLGYLDYCCRDDYGAGIATVSAWAGLHYFASRHGFAAGAGEGERDAVFTWPEGNAWLAERLAAPLAGRLHPGQTVLALRESRHAVQLLTFDEATGASRAWEASLVVLAVPLFIARRIVHTPVPALSEAAAALTYAPWVVANLLLDRPLFDRGGAPPAWDNVVFGSTGLGYVDAGHQSLDPRPGPGVLTAYHALPVAGRARLLTDDAAGWTAHLLADLEVAHPDLRQRVQRAELMRWGHAMAIPRPGVHGHPALAALRAAKGRVRFAHADLAGYSVFEEAFTAGCEVAAAPLPPP